MIIVSSRCYTCKFIRFYLIKITQKSDGLYHFLPTLGDGPRKAMRMSLDLIKVAKMVHRAQQLSHNNLDINTIRIQHQQTRQSSIATSDKAGPMAIPSHVSNDWSERRGLKKRIKTKWFLCVFFDSFWLITVATYQSSSSRPPRGIERPARTLQHLVLLPKYM